jgi:uncharacterized protein (DUF58 family)
MKRAVAPKLYGMAIVAGLTVWAGLLAGRLELVVAAAPMSLAVVAGVAASREPEISVEVALDAARCLEGDLVEAAITLTTEGPMRDVRVALVVPSAFEVAEGSSDVTLALASGGSQSVRVQLRAVRWGVHRVGVVGVRVFGPGRFVVWEMVHDRAVEIKVFPHLERVHAGLRPPDTQLFAGDHVARASGDGIEFALVRPFQRGDRVRSVNWRVTTRRGELHVNVFHPERNADVVVFLDTFGDFGSERSRSLEMAVRGAAGVVQHHLRHKDRVGLVAFGGEVRWLTASMGRTQIYRIVDVLLASRALFSYAWKGIEHLPRQTLLPSALVVAFSPLIDARAISALDDLAARGFPLVVVDTLDQEAVEPEPGDEGALAYRVWLLERSALRAEFATRGVPVVVWSEQDGLDAALASVSRLPRVGVV